MPIYEYFCADCRQRVSVFFRSMEQAQHETARCPTCGGTDLERLVSRVATPKSETRKLEEIASPSLMQGLSQEDPRALAAYMRRMSNEVGEPMDAEMTEAIERWEAGAPLGPNAEAAPEDQPAAKLPPPESTA